VSCDNELREYDDMIAMGRTHRPSGQPRRIWRLLQMEIELAQWQQYDEQVPAFEERLGRVEHQLASM
jgi:hypothetical protein